MATISYSKGNGRYKVMVSKEELNTLTIAVALLNVVDMESEAKEQGLDLSKLDYNHLELFNKLTKVTSLYPMAEVSLKGEIIDETV